MLLKELIFICLELMFLGQPIHFFALFLFFFLYNSWLSLKPTFIITYNYMIMHVDGLSSTFMIGPSFLNFLIGCSSIGPHILSFSWTVHTCLHNINKAYIEKNFLSLAF